MPKQTYSSQNANNYSEIVIVYADYIISEINKGNSPSVRSVAKYFKSLNIPELARSHVTIYKLLTEVLPIVDYEKYLMIRKLFDKNNDRKKSIEDMKIRIRVLNVANMVLKGLTIDEIVYVYNQNLPTGVEPITHDIVYRDITTRLKNLSVEDDIREIYLEVQKKLSENSLNNLSFQNGNLAYNDYTKQSRDENGRFKK